MEQKFLFCFAILAATCLVSVPSVLGAEAADKLWSVVDATQNQMGMFWTAVNMSGYVQSPKFASIAAGNYTFLAPGNGTMHRFAEEMGLSLRAIATNASIGKLLFPLIDYHILKGLEEFAKLPLNTPTSFNTLLTGQKNDLCDNVGPVNITKISSSHAVVSAGGNTAVMNLTAKGPASSNDAYAVYGLDSILSPCCLDIDFSTLDLTTLMKTPELRSYIASLDFTSPVLKAILPFLTFVLKFIKDNSANLNTMPFTVVLPYPDVIANGLQSMDPSMQNEDTYKAIFLNHVMAVPVNFDTVTAAGGKQSVKTLLDDMYGPFVCNNTVVASISPGASNSTQLLPMFGSASTSAGYKLCNGGIVYFADSLILPCNVTDAVYSVANNMTSEVKASAPAMPAGGSSGSSSSGVPAASTSAGSGSTTKTASPAAMAAPMQWGLNVVLGFVLLTAVL